MTLATNKTRGWMALLLLGLAVACGPGLRAAVTLHVTRAPGTPKLASVQIDEEYVGPLYYVAARGVRLPKGVHRISITHDGYFPWDLVVEAGRQPIDLKVEMVPVPD